MIRIAALALTLASGAQQSLPSDSAVRAFIVPRVAAFPVSGKHGAGIVVGLLDATGARRIVAAGVDSTRLFEIGSITKVFTTSVLEDMVERGEVRCRRAAFDRGRHAEVSRSQRRFERDATVAHVPSYAR